MVLDVSVLCGQSVAWRALIVWRGRPKKISPEAAHWRSRSWKIQLCPGCLFQLSTWVQVGPQCKIKVRGERNHLADASSQARHLLSPPSALSIVGLAVGQNTEVKRTHDPWHWRTRHSGGKSHRHYPGSLYPFKEKATRVSCLVEEQRSAVGLETLSWRGVLKQGHFPLCLSQPAYQCEPPRPAGGCLLSWFLSGAFCWFLRVNVRKVIFFGELWNCPPDRSPAELPPGALEK